MIGEVMSIYAKPLCRKVKRFFILIKCDLYGG